MLSVRYELNIQILPRDGVFVIGRLAHLRNLVLRFTKITIGHTRFSRFSQSVTLFTSRCLVTSSTANVPLSLGYQTLACLSYQLITATAHNY
jgi:hypothetical protein